MTRELLTAHPREKRKECDRARRSHSPFNPGRHFLIAEYKIYPIVARFVTLIREGGGASVDVNTVAAPPRAGQGRERTAFNRATEERQSGRIVAVGVVGGDVGRIGRQGNSSVGQVNLLPATGSLSGGGGTGQQRAGGTPKAHRMRTGIQGGLVEADGRDLAGGRGLEFDAHLQLNGVS
jgi:hypothetical protein